MLALNTVPPRALRRVIKSTSDVIFVSDFPLPPIPKAPTSITFPLDSPTSRTAAVLRPKLFRASPTLVAPVPPRLTGRVPVVSPKSGFE